MCCSCGGGSSGSDPSPGPTPSPEPSECENTNNGAVDEYDMSCDDYFGYEDYCGEYDTEDFDANAMCCAC